MIKKGGNPSPVQVRQGTKGFNVWVYNRSTFGADGIIRHHYKTLTARGKYYSRDVANEVGWHYINTQTV